MKVIIPVAGAGARLRPHTHTKPKPILPVAGKPMIDHIIDDVLPLHPTEIIFITGHLRERFEKHIREQYHDKVKFKFVEQRELNGTAGAVWLGKEAFDEDILIIFGDTIFTADLSVIKHAKEDGLIWTMHVEDPRRFGVVVTDEDGHITRFVEKPQEFVSHLASIGVLWIKNTKLLAEGIEHTIKNLTDAIAFMIEHGAKVKPQTCTGWFDCGTPEAMLDTNKVLLEKKFGKHEVKISDTVTIIPPVAIHPSAHLERCVVGPHVTVGALAVIKDAVIQNSIIDQEASVSYTLLDKSIIGENARVQGVMRSIHLGDHSTLE
jgi:glucose-1-phosphate thymidylyltransferase